MSKDNRDDDDDSPVNEAKRMYAAISFAVVLLVIGMPLWWFTTEVYRAPLPEDRMHALSDAPLSLALNVTLVSQSYDRASIIVEEIRSYFVQTELFNANIHLLKPKSNWIPNHLSDPDETSCGVKVPPGDIFLMEWPECPHEVLFTSCRVVYFSPNTTGSKLIRVLDQVLLQTKTITQMVVNMKTPGLEKQDSTIRRRVPAAKHYQIMVTSVNPDPDNLEMDWNLPQATKQYLTPFLKSVSHITNFTLKSQWLHLVTLGTKPKQVADPSLDDWNGRWWALSDNDLPYIITMFERRLSSHISNNPSLNLVAYIPPCQFAPIRIVRAADKIPYGGPNAFLSPRWGGIIIANPSPTECVAALENDVPAKIVPDSHLIMSTFITQLRQLIGIALPDPISGVEYLPLKNVTPRDWELDSLMRLRALEQLTSARLTLKSLVQLLTEIKNIVINDDVGQSIHSAVESAEVSAEYLAEGQLETAFQISKEAFLSSESAFSDPTLLALLYFPDDQKYAVYIPLFLPIMIPVIMSLNTIRLWMWPSSTKAKVKSD